MTRLSIDLEADEHIRNAPHDADAAAMVLVCLAKRLRSREVICDNLADFIADAIEVATSKPSPKQRAKALTDELYLTANNRRPANWLAIGGAAARLRDAGASPTKAAELAAESLGVDRKTARTCLRIFDEATAETESINERESREKV